MIQESTSVNGWAFGIRQYTNNWIVFGNNINLNPTLTTSNSTVYQQAQRLVSNGDGSVVLSGTINATMLNELVEAVAFATENGANITGIRNYNSGSDAMIWNNDYSNTNSFGGSAFGVANNITVGGKILSTTDIAGAVVIGDGSTLNLLNKSGVTAVYGSFLEWQHNIYVGDNASLVQQGMNYIFSDLNNSNNLSLTRRSLVKTSILVLQGLEMQPSSRKKQTLT